MIRPGLLLTLLVASAPAMAASPLTLWSMDPWTTTFRLDIAPEVDESLEALDLYAARGEYESGALMITNTSEPPATLYARVRVEPSPRARRQAPLPPENIVLREAVHLRERRGTLVADPLPRLSDRGIIAIPPGETRQLWLEVRTHGLAAGTYSCRVKIDPTGHRGTSQVELRLHVWDFRLPEPMPIAVFNWDYRIAKRGEPGRSQYFRDLVAHGVNCFHISGSPTVQCDDQGDLVAQPDFSSWDDLIELERPHATMFLFETWQFRGRPFTSDSGKTIEYLSTEWARAFEQWLTAFVAYTRQRGLTYQDWAFYPFDEHIGPDFVGLAKEIKRIDPEVLIFTDRVEVPELVRAAAPYVDIWCPYDGHFGREEFQESFEIMRDTGKPIWFYFGGTNQKRFAPLGRYRLMGWKAWDRKLQGCTYWNVFGRTGSEWDDYDGGGPDPGTVYQGANGPVPSRRWEAFREGLEDYCYLFLLDRAANAASAGQDDPALERARAVLARASSEVLAAGDAATLHKWRHRLAAAILALKRGER